MGLTGAKLPEDWDDGNKDENKKADLRPSRWRKVWICLQERLTKQWIASVFIWGFFYAYREASRNQAPCGFRTNPSFFSTPFANG
jgi:hypothetical protein